MVSAWTKFKAFFDSDVDAVVRENERLRLDNDLLRNENKRCEETEKRSEDYMEECYRVFMTWMKCHYSSRFNSMKNELTLHFLQNTDTTAERMKQLESSLEYSCDEVRELTKQLKEAKAQIDHLNAFINTLPEGYMYAYNLFMKNNKDQE